MTTTALPAHTPVRTASGIAAGAAAALAGGIHLAVVPEHLEGPPTVPAFFLVVGMAQLVVAAVLVVGSLRASSLMGLIAAHVALIGLYVASRTVDLPFLAPHQHGQHGGPEAAPGAVGNGIPVYPGARVEPVGVLDAVCVGAEVVLVVLLLARVPDTWRRATLNVLALVGIGAVGLRLLG